MENFTYPSRLIFLDWSVYLHKSVKALKNNPTVYPTYMAVTMIISCLTRLALDPDDKVIFLRDGRASWRKEFESAYKGDRKEKKAHDAILNQNVDITTLKGLINTDGLICIDWNYWYAEFDKLAEKLEAQTNWSFIGPIQHIEADDLASVACRFFKDAREIVLVTIDSDWEQMWIYPNVKNFNMGKDKEWKEKPDDYNVYTELAKKINKESSDNLVSSAMTEEERDIRQSLVDLTRLPEWVESICIEALSKPEIYTKNIFPEKIMFPSLEERFNNLFNDHSKYISYEDQVMTRLYKEAKEKDKKFEAKAKLKRAKEREMKKITKIKTIIKKTKGIKND